MYQIDNPTASATLPASTSAGSAGYFTDGNPATGLAPTVVPAEFLNMLMMESVNVVQGAGIALDKSKNGQVLQAIRRLVQKTTVLADTGSANVYAAANIPALASGDLVTGIRQQLLVANTNTGASTFAPDGLSAKPIWGMGLVPLQGGELIAGGMATLVYSAAANGNAGAWILERCSGGAQQGVVATQSNQLMTLGQAGALAGTTGMLGLFPFNSAPSGWLKVNGAAIPIAGYSTLAALLYCGDANNATAAWGYRCTNQSSPTTSRSISGSYIVLPDARGEFLRAWDDGRGVDIGRVLWAMQSGQILSHSHGVSDPGHAHSVNDPGHSHTVSPGGVIVAGSGGTGLGSAGAYTASLTADARATGISLYAAATGISLSATGGAENLVRNLAALVCIKY